METTTLAGPPQLQYIHKFYVNLATGTEYKLTSEISLETSRLNQIKDLKNVYLFVNEIQFLSQRFFE